MSGNGYKRCAVPSCNNKYLTNKNVRYFLFPKNKKIGDLWLKAIKNPLFMDKPYEAIRYRYSVCGEHFKADQFQNAKKEKLLRGAIPFFERLYYSVCLPKMSTETEHRTTEEKLHLEELPKEEEIKSVEEEKVKDKEEEKPLKETTWGHLGSTERLGRATLEDEFVKIELEDFDKEEYKDATHATHCMIYAEATEKAFDLYDLRAHIMMQMRFDGYLGFPGGLVDKGEDRLEALQRELQEEMNTSDLKITEEERIVSHWSPIKKLMLHFYAHKVPPYIFKQLEGNALKAIDYGTEVLGLIRVPLYTMGDKFRGFPCFLSNVFVGNSKQQLLKALVHLKIMTQEEIDEAKKAPMIY